ncbi:hypothetical protein SH467x_004288 [Pirellulaceae bacterium SH467]|jgi:hypothetical protein
MEVRSLVQAESRVTSERQLESASRILYHGHSKGTIEMVNDESTSSQQDRRAVWKLGGYILWIALVSTVLCAMNTGMVFALTKGLETKLPEFPGSNQLMQFMLAVVPVLLLFAEWYAWDILTTRRYR